MKGYKRSKIAGIWYFLIQSNPEQFKFAVFQRDSNLRKLFLSGKDLCRKKTFSLKLKLNHSAAEKLNH